MKIAIIGIRGIPVIYSAFETFAQVLGIGLVKQKHKVSVYCRKNYVLKDIKIYKEMEIVTLPHINSKSYSTLTHSFFATVHACFKGKYDIILYLGVGNTLFSIFPRLVGIKSIVHIDGLDWKRKKWGFIGRNFLKLSEYLTTFFPNDVITDSEFMKAYYKKRYKKNINYIPYGYFHVPRFLRVKEVLKKYNLKKAEYFVWVGRLVPENYIEEFITAFSKLKNSQIQCLILGDDLHESAYKKEIYALLKQDKRIIHPGFIKHEEVLVLEANSLAYIETKRSGGTHMSLVEAMGVGTLIVSHKNPGNKGVLEDTALYYDNENRKTSLASMLRTIVRNSENFQTLRSRVKTRAESLYEWRTVVLQYEKLFVSVM